MQVNDISGIVLDESIRVHREIGPGVLESVYEAILAKRLVKRGLVVERQRIVPLTIDGEEFREVFRVDLLINGLVIVELKSVEDIHRVHFKQVLT